jgi:hypothetical protein
LACVWAFTISHRMTIANDRWRRACDILKGLLSILRNNESKYFRALSENMNFGSHITINPFTVTCNAPDISLPMKITLARKNPLTTRVFTETKLLVFQVASRRKQFNHYNFLAFFARLLSRKSTTAKYKAVSNPLFEKSSSSDRPHSKFDRRNTIALKSRPELVQNVISRMKRKPSLIFRHSHCAKLLNLWVECRRNHLNQFRDLKFGSHQSTLWLV